MKVLVTGFNKFGKNENNYSEEVIKYINNVSKIILDVAYDICYDELISKCNLDDYGLIIALGEARMREELTLEIQARNVASCSLADNRGIVKQDNEIVPYGAEAIRTRVNIEKCRDFVQFSFDAGKFVCNNLYYHLLTNYPNKSIFIHVPNCNNSIEKYLEYAKKIELIISTLICE